MNLLKQTEYQHWLQDIKEQIRGSQIKAALKVNSELILLYFSIGKQIVEKQNKITWGNSIIEQLSKDLKKDLNDTNGFSKSNLYAMRQFYTVFSNFHQLGGELDEVPDFVKKYCVRMPWRHLVIIELKVGDFKPEYIGKLNFYLNLVDATLKKDYDKPSIGILHCKTKEKFEIEFSLKDINKPIGVSEYKFNELPLEIKQKMPSVEELECELKRLSHE